MYDTFDIKFEQKSNNNMDQTYYDVLDKLLTEHKIRRITASEVKKTKRIGKGSQSRVYLGEFEGKSVAIKELFEFDIKCIVHEIAILSKLEMENLPKFMGVILDETDKELSYVTSFVTGRSLDEIDVEKLPEEAKIYILKQLSNIITFIHDNNCIHRDLKAENVMIDQELKVYLIDFGISKVLSPDDKTIETRAKGTMNYLAPEILDISTIDDKGQIISKITTKVDVWAFCCLASYIFSGIIPWTDKFKKTTLIQIQLTKKAKFPIPPSIKNKEIIDIINSGMIAEVNIRKSMRDINDLVQSIKI